MARHIEVCGSVLELCVLVTLLCDLESSLAFLAPILIHFYRAECYASTVTMTETMTATSTMVEMSTVTSTMTEVRFLLPRLAFAVKF